MSTFRFGVDYYPEQWPRSRWETDAQLMREAGFNVVRLAEFAWARLEPQEGNFDFGWLDEAMAVLERHGIAVVLGTPTASPPPWVYAQNPEMFRTGPDGVCLPYGHRRGYSPHHPEYRAHARRIVTAMATHYAAHPAVLGWQIDNEFGDRDYGPAAQGAFGRWLEARYLTLDALNSAWGTEFWSHTYSAWSQIPTPLTHAAPHNPGLGLDFARFSSAAYAKFQGEQIEILRRLAPSQKITHNLMGFSPEQLDYFELARDLDWVSWDNYPRMWWNVYEGDDPARVALSHATMRGMKRQNFWVMEQQSGPGGWERVVPQPRPGELRLWAMQAVAHGADGIVFFRFRTARHGAEQYWHGLLEHDGRPGRRYQEVVALGAEIAPLGTRLVGSKVQAPVAMLLSYEARFALQVQQNHPNLSYTEQFGYWYRALHTRNVGVDVLEPLEDLSDYALVIAPLLHVVSPELAHALERYVRGGGTLVLTARSGVKDSDNAVVDAPLPGLLRHLCGVEVEEYDSLINLENGVTLEHGGHTLAVNIWCDVLALEGAEVLGRYAHDYYAGRAAVTRHRYGAGQTVYVGALGDSALPEALTDWLLGQCGMQPLLETPPGVEATLRSSESGAFLFVLNHAQKSQTLRLPEPWNETWGDTLTLEPYGVRVLERVGVLQKILVG